ncbi:UNVERIFIED_CONTAM: Clp protease adapter protein ClpF, chloroplastic [Sesamum radiatum]|uniref:Clp protease adapter protein ClpF, chloroplastic n=2 Tax=Sesamum TaxID=4181 RepID=A0AAW2MYL3_SESRA
MIVSSKTEVECRRIFTEEDDLFGTRDILVKYAEPESCVTHREEKTHQTDEQIAAEKPIISLEFAQQELCCCLEVSFNPDSVVCGSNDEWRRNFGQVKEPHILPGAGSLCLCSYSGRTTSFGGPCSISRPRSLRVQAGWLFKGSDKGSEFDASTEHSESANEDILMFFFELDLATRVQVESEVIRLRESRRGSASKSEAQDMAISILRLRADLQNAVESENYSLAAELRDEISKLEAKSLAASVKAQAYENAQYAFRLGQKVKHKKFGYRAVICGMDPVCCESKTWMDRANVEKLARGPDQPFYQVLVDMHEDPNLLVAYVPEENLQAPDKQDTDRFDHPYASFLFYGMDAAGDFIPIKQLREKYSQPRHELPYDPLDEEDGKDA